MAEVTRPEWAKRARDTAERAQEGQGGRGALLPEQSIKRTTPGRGKEKRKMGGVRRGGGEE